MKTLHINCTFERGYYTGALDHRTSDGYQYSGEKYEEYSFTIDTDDIILGIGEIDCFDNYFHSHSNHRECYQSFIKGEHYSDKSNINISELAQKLNEVQHKYQYVPCDLPLEIDINRVIDKSRININKANFIIRNGVGSYTHEIIELTKEYERAVNTLKEKEEESTIKELGLLLPILIKDDQVRIKDKFYKQYYPLDILALNRNAEMVTSLVLKYGLDYMVDVNAIYTTIVTMSPMFYYDLMVDSKWERHSILDITKLQEYINELEYMPTLYDRQVWEDYSLFRGIKAFAEYIFETEIDKQDDERSSLHGSLFGALCHHRKILSYYARCGYLSDIRRCVYLEHGKFENFSSHTSLSNILDLTYNKECAHILQRIRNNEESMSYLIQHFSRIKDEDFLLIFENTIERLSYGNEESEYYRCVKLNTKL